LLHGSEQDFGDSRNTSWALHSQVGPPKLIESRGIEEIPPRPPLTLEHRKPENRVPLLTDLGGESKGKEPRRVHAYIPHKIPKRKASLQKITKKRPEITKKNEQEQHIQALRNHVESFIHHKEVHTRSSLPPDHPSLSQDLTMKLSS
jgi:hypothetical protein